MKRDDDLKMKLDESFSHVPDSLYQFVDELPDRYDKGEFGPGQVEQTRHKVFQYIPAMFKSAVAAAILAIALAVGVTSSPVVASYIKGVPGFQIAVDWLTSIRESEGVQKAINHQYTPIEPAVLQLDGTMVTISDIYLTNEELLFKAFIRSDELAETDSGNSVRILVLPANLQGGGSHTSTYIAETIDSSGIPVLLESYKYQLEEEAVDDFWAHEGSLKLEVNKYSFNNHSREAKTEKLGLIEIPVDKNNLMHNKVLEFNQKLNIPDPDLQYLILERLVIQPTTMNITLGGYKGWEVYFPFPWDENTAPLIKDDKGNPYRYDPSGPVRMMEEGKQQLPFSSSVFFDSDVRTLYLHIGEISVTERSPSASFELSFNDTFPKTVQFKNRNIVIEGLEYKDGCIHLKISKEHSDQTQLEGIAFDIVEQEDMTGKFAEEGLEAYHEFARKQKELREALNVSGFGIAEDYAGKPYLSVYIPAPHLDHYTITLQRANDTIAINQDYLIPLE